MPQSGLRSSWKGCWGFSGRIRAARRRLATVCYKVVRSGQVQGVAFRAMMRDHALRSGVVGWVRNRDDGAVEDLVQGEESRVEWLLEWVRVGPPEAKVDRAPVHAVFVTDPGSRRAANR